MTFLGFYSNIAFCAMWLLLHRYFFIQGNIRHKILSEICLLCTPLILTLAQGLIIEPVASMAVIICVSSVIVLLEGKDVITLLAEISITYISAKGMTLICIVVAIFTRNTFLKTSNDVSAFIIQIAVEVVLLVVLKAASTNITLSIIIEKRSRVILTMCFVLFTLSYGLFRNMAGTSASDQFKYILTQYAIAVFAACAVIVIVWTISEHLRQKEVNHLTEELKRLISEAHRTKEIMPSVSKQLQNLKTMAEHMDSPEFSQELGVTLKELSELDIGVQQRNFQEFKLNQPFPSPSTGFRLLDSQLSVEKGRTAALGIDLECVVSAPVSTLQHIPQFEIQQVLGDLVSNAIHAAELSNTSPKRVLLILGVVQGVYQAQVYDTGVPFPEQVLCRIGQRGNTTDGTGNGLIDTMAVLCEYGASLTIKEFSTGLWMKCITVRFDGLCLLTTDFPKSGVQVRPIEMLIKKD